MENSQAKASDLSFLKTMTGDNKEKMTKYINMFLQGAPALVSQLDQNLQSADWSSLKTTAHTLKSQFSYMGVSEAKEIALSIENNAAQNTNLEQIPAQVERIKIIFLTACEELKAAVQAF